MIKKIIIKDTATYDENGVEINDLKKVNFFYGANGSGKTTIANVIQSPEQHESCLIEWEGNSALPCLVYNKRFRDENFSSTKIPGVFTLGSATIEQKKALEEKNKKLDEITQESVDKNNTIIKLEKDKKDDYDLFKESCWLQIKKKYEQFKEAFIGVLNSKEKFAEKVIYEFENNNEALSTIEEIQEKSKTLFGELPIIMDAINVIEDTLSSIENDVIWNKKIIGKSDIEIAPLIQRLNINDWVNQGREYIQPDSDICPFCQKRTIDDVFRKQIEDYFDDNYKKDLNRLKELAGKYDSEARTIITFLQQIVDKESSNQQTKLEIESFKAFFDILQHITKENSEIINSKLKEPSRSFDLSQSLEQINKINELIAKANKKIKENNNIVDNFYEEKEKLITQLWKYIIEENRSLIESHIKKDTGLQKGINALNVTQIKLRERSRTLKSEIEEDNKNITSIQASIDEINKILDLYGFTNFTIVPTSDNCYQIQRKNGENAQNTLSEGEITFITFLYYMQLIHGGTKPENAGESKVLIIDDPISSLDSNILYVVSSLIKEEIKALKKDESNIKQIILLTHNIYFHKEVSFIDGRTKENNETGYWIIRKNGNQSTIQSYGIHNPIRGSYELLWDELKSNELSCSTLQNTMRRIYETYFKVLGKYGDDDVLLKFDNPVDREICRSLLCWINDGSHCIPDDLHIGYQEDSKEKYLHVFKMIFDIMGHIEHYNMMMGIDDSKVETA